MAHALTNRYERVIDRLIESGHFANRSEVVRAGLRELEEKYLREDYLHPPPLKSGVLKRIYQNQTKAERDEEISATRASHRPKDDGQE